MQPRRKLAAITFVDIAGYTSKVNKDERRALEIREEVERLVKSSTLGHLGKVIKTMGDGAMLEFSSAVEAVTCALEIRDQMDELNSRLALAEPVQVRIGVHVGDVVEEENDLFGNAVNIASRVHSIAQPGGICITREVYVQIRPLLKLQCMPVKVTGASNMPERVEVFQIVGAEQARIAQPKKLRLATVTFLVAAALIVVFGTSKWIQSRAIEELPKGAHRLLLPDWVSPGDSFTLDAGPDSERLAVYFGNRKAATRLENGKLSVITPTNLPSDQTTISVFLGDESRPLMTQMTQVINPMRVASLGTRENELLPKPGRIAGGPAPSESKSSGEESNSSRGMNTGNSGVPKPDDGDPPMAPVSGSGHLTAPVPSTPNKAINQTVMMSDLDGYENLVGAIPDEDFGNVEVMIRRMPSKPGGIQKALMAVSLAAQGKNQDAEKALIDLKTVMPKMGPAVAKEVTSLMKSAQAMMDNNAGNDSDCRKRFADAFAFSMNNGTNHFAGIALVDRMIRCKDYDEAKRAIELMRKRGGLTDGEQKALAKLDDRIKKDTSQTGSP